MSSNKRKIISASIRHDLLETKTCANIPGIFATGCKGYYCPM
jgi:hypothetical protein